MKYVTIETSPNAGDDSLFIELWNTEKEAKRRKDAEVMSYDEFIASGFTDDCIYCDHTK